MELTRPLERTVETQEFPCTTAEFLAAHGETELSLPNGTETLAEVLDPLPDEEFETAEDARLAVYNAMGEGAIGRKGYSDRDPTCLGEDGHEHVSL
jgi:hypothetical protein